MNRERGTTVFLTTHNLDEANQLCHRVAIIHRGRSAAIDTPQALRGAIESRRCVEVVFAEAPGAAPPVSDPAAVLETVAGGAGVRVYTRSPGAAAQEIATWATGRGLRIESISTRGPSLEDVFLSLTAPASAPSDGSVGARA
jgi:ABC-2 type transport system ATP-binding protein